MTQTMARRLWPGRDPVGRRFRYGAPGEVAKNDWLTVVGVAGDTIGNPETHPISVIYFPVRQKVWDVLALMVRTQSDPVSMEAAIDDRIHQIDRTLPRTDPSTVEEQLWNLGSQRRFQIELFTLFSFFAVVLATVGIYGVMAYAVGQRTREIGIRMALGAQRVEVLLMMLHQALLPVGLGLLAGRGHCAGRQPHVCRTSLRRRYDRPWHLRERLFAPARDSCRRRLHSSSSCKQSRSPGCVAVRVVRRRVGAMSWLRNIADGLRSLIWRERTDRELDEELGGFLEMSIAVSDRRQSPL